MPTLNQLSISDIDNVNVFDKKVWDTILPIQAMANDAILQSPLVKILDSCRLDEGGNYAVVNFTKRISSDADQQIAKTDINIEGISQIQDAYVAISRYKSWGQEQLAKDIIGENLLKQVEEYSPQYWADNYQKFILNMLRGIFAGTLSTSHSLDAGTHTMSWEAIELATSKLGDRAKSLATVIMHSAQFSNLKQQGVVKYKDAGDLGYKIWTEGQIPSVNGLPIIVTDTVPVETVGGVTKYHAYLGGAGAIEFRNISFNNVLHWDTKAAGTDYLIQTVRIMTRVPGVKFVQSNASNQTNPTNADFLNPACWQKVAEDSKDIPLVELITTAQVIPFDNE